MQTCSSLCDQYRRIAVTLFLTHLRTLKEAFRGHSQQNRGGSTAIHLRWEELVSLATSSQWCSPGRQSDYQGNLATFTKIPYPAEARSQEANTMCFFDSHLENDGDDSHLKSHDVMTAEAKAMTVILKMTTLRLQKITTLTRILRINTETNTEH